MLLFTWTQVAGETLGRGNKGIGGERINGSRDGGPIAGNHSLVSAQPDFGIGILGEFREGLPVDTKR